MDSPYGAIAGNDRTLAIATKFIMTRANVPIARLFFRSITEFSVKKKNCISRFYLGDLSSVTQSFCVIDICFCVDCDANLSCCVLFVRFKK